MKFSSSEFSSFSHHFSVFIMCDHKENKKISFNAWIRVFFLRLHKLIIIGFSSLSFVFITKTFIFIRILRPLLRLMQLFYIDVMSERMMRIFALPGHNDLFSLNFCRSFYRPSRPIDTQPSSSSIQNHQMSRQHLE